MEHIERCPVPKDQLLVASEWATGSWVDAGRAWVPAGVDAGSWAAELVRNLDRALDSLTESQRLAVFEPAQAVCVLAGAGSGKTRVLTLRVARRIRDGEAEADHTVVCTFTRKAASDLRARLRRSAFPQ